MTPPKSIHLRLGRTSDLEAIVRLNAHVQEIHAVALPALFKEHPDPAHIRSEFAAKIEKPAALWVVAENPEPVGYLYAELRDRPDSWGRHPVRVCNINHLVVAPGVRRQGVARSLVAFATSEASSRGYARVELDVWSFNSEAKRCFTALGFEVYNERMVLRNPS